MIFLFCVPALGQVVNPPTPTTPSTVTSFGQGVWNRRGTVVYPNLGGNPSYSVEEPVVISNDQTSAPQILTQYTHVWKMWYNWGGSLNYAESADGINWTQQANTFLATHAEPNIIVNGSTYYLFANNLGTTSLDVYTATNGITFTSLAAGVISGGNNSGGVFISGTLYLFVEQTTGVVGLHLYTSTAPYTTYTDQGSLGLYRGPTNPVQSGGKWWMWVHYDATSSPNCPALGGGCSRIQRLSAPAITGPWTNSETTNSGDDFWPQTVEEMGGAHIIEQAADPFVFEYLGKTYMYYTASYSDATRQYQVIKLATADMPLANLVQTTGGPQAYTDNTNSWGVTYDPANGALNMRSLGLESVNTLAVTGTVETLGTISGNRPTFQVLDNGSNSTNPQFQACSNSTSSCMNLLMDYFGSFGAGTGSVGHGINISGGRNLAGYDSLWLRNTATNVYAAAVNTSYPGGNMGAFATDHDWLVGAGLGWWNGTVRAKFTLPTVSAARNWTMLDMSGNVPVSTSTSQKTETGADTNVLTVTPAANVGTYQACITLSLSAANAATIGWTITYTDSNGNAQTPTNLALLQQGTAAPALTFTTSAAGNYSGCFQFDVNSAGTNIVVKTTFSGTSMAAKVSATVTRIQ